MLNYDFCHFLKFCNYNSTYNFLFVFFSHIDFFHSCVRQIFWCHSCVKNHFMSKILFWLYVLIEIFIFLIVCTDCYIFFGLYVLIDICFFDCMYIVLIDISNFFLIVCTDWYFFSHIRFLVTTVQTLPLSVIFACFVIFDCCHIEVFKKINIIQNGNANKYQHNASLDELEGITGISDRRAQKIIKIRE